MELILSPSDYVSILVRVKTLGNAIVYTDPMFIEQQHHIFGGRAKQAIMIPLPDENSVFKFMSKVAELSGFHYSHGEVRRGDERWSYRFIVTEILPQRSEISLEKNKLTRACLTHIVGPLLGVSPEDYLLV